MEKNKNRTDLLAAGRKKLQQFRQKKETKSGSHGKSSHKSSKSDHDVDGELRPIADKQSTPSTVAETGAALQAAADVEPVDSVILQGTGNSLVPEADVSFVNPSVSTVAVDSGSGESVQAIDSLLESKADSEVAPAPLALLVGVEGEDVSVLVTADAEPAGSHSIGDLVTLDANASIINSSSSPAALESSSRVFPSSTDDANTEGEVDVPVSVVMEGFNMDIFGQADEAQIDSLETLGREVAGGGASSNEGELVPVDVEVSDSITAPVQVEGANLGEEKVSFSSPEDHHSLSLVQAKEDQEADGMGSIQFDGNVEETHESLYGGENSEVGSVKVELERDWRLVESACLENGDPAEAAAAVEHMKQETHEAEQTTEVYGVNVSADATYKLEGYCVGDGHVSADASEVAEETSPTDHTDPQVMLKAQKDNAVTVSSYEENWETLHPSPDLETEPKEQAQRVVEKAKTGIEVYVEQYFSEGDVVLVGERPARPLEAKTKGLPGGQTVSLGSGDVFQLEEVLRRLDEDEFKFLLKSRESYCLAYSSDTGASCIPGNGSADILGSLKEQLYLANVAKEVLHLQLVEQDKQHVEFDQCRCELVDEISKLSASLKEMQERNMSLSKELVECRTELQASTARAVELETQLCTKREEVEDISVSNFELQTKLERSQEELENLLTELANCKGVLDSLQMENANLNGSLTLVTKERKKLEEENEYLAHENKKQLSQLLDHQKQLAVEQGNHWQLEVNLEEAIARLNQLTDEYICLSSSLDIHKVNLISAIEERKKLEEEKVDFLHQNEKLSAELVNHQDQLATQQCELLQLGVDLKEAIARHEQLTEKNIVLSNSLDAHKAKLKEIDNKPMQLFPESEEGGNQQEGSNVLNMIHDDAVVDEGSHRIPDKHEGEIIGRPAVLTVVESLLPLEQLKKNCLDVCVGLKDHLEEAEGIMDKIERAIEGMHSHSTALSRSGGKITGSGVSKLIQAFESKVSHDDNDSEQVLLTEGEKLMAGPFKFAKEQMGNMRDMLKELYQDAEKANGLFREEQDNTKLASVACNELKVLYETLKHEMSDLEVENSELKVQCEISKIQSFDIEAKNNDLINKLSVYQSRVGDLESQLHGIQQSSDEKATTIFNEIENLQKEVGNMASSIEQEWSSAAVTISQAVEMLDKSIEKLFSPISTGCSNAMDFGCHVVASVTVATKAIEDLHKKLELANTDCETLRSLYVELDKNFSDLHVRNELAFGVLEKIHWEIRKLLNDSCRGADESDMHLNDVKLLDPLELTSYEPLIEQLCKLLGERLQLESASNELKSELVNRMHDIEELNRKCLDSKAILKLVEDVASVVKLDAVEVDSDKAPFSLLESAVSVLLQKYQEVNDHFSLSREDFESKVTELSELQAKMHHITSVNHRQEDEICLVKGSLQKMEEELEAFRSELQVKVSELEQSEQRVSTLREKLSIAVAKGKGLVVQRDSLKQSLAEISTELEQRSQELQIKDGRIHEVETKLKAYSEAGERIEALESELSYIRNSSTGLRESFLLKDSVLQRIEEILEDLELPEPFHCRDIIEKIDWLARSVNGNLLPLTDWDQKSSVGGGSYSDAGFVVMDAWKEDFQPSSNTGDDFRRQYEELQSKFYGLAEQNEMLEQSLMEKNNVVQRWEEVLDRINMPLQLRSVDPEDRIVWLGNALSEAHNDRDSLQQKVENFEAYCESLKADLEELQGKISDLEASVLVVTREKEFFSASLENLSREHDKVSKKAAEYELEKNYLQNEVTSLQAKLVEKLENEECHQNIEVEIGKLQVLVSDALQCHGADDVASTGNSAASLEGLLRKLIDNYTTLTSEKPMLKETVKGHDTEETDMAADANESDAVVLKKQLQDAVGNLSLVEEERNAIIANHKSLVTEVETLNRQKDDLQERLNQEEQKLTATREKLNVAVRKGKGLVQQRDTLKQNIEDMNTEVQRLKGELVHKENALVHYELRIKDLSTYVEKTEALESGRILLGNRLEELEHILQKREQTLSRLLNTLHAIDLGDEYNNNIDPVEKLEQIGRLCGGLREGMSSAEHEARKSKRAADLLVTELNEVQERADGLQEELAKTEALVLQLSKERDITETARVEVLSHLEKLISENSEERKYQCAEIMKFEAAVDQLKKGYFGFGCLIEDVFSNGQTLLYNLEASMQSWLKQIDGNDLVDLHLLKPSGGIFSDNSLNEVKFPARVSPPEKMMQKHFDYNNIMEAFGHVNDGLQECVTEIGTLQEKLYKHCDAFEQEAKSLYKVMETVHRELASSKESLEKDKDIELLMLRRNVSLLYEACSHAISVIENKRAQMIGSGLASEMHEIGVNLKQLRRTDEREPVDSFTEEHIRSMSQTLLVAVKDSAKIQAEIVAGSQKDLESTILSMQKEIQEKDIQGKRICEELVSQIKEAEAVAETYLLDLESTKTQVHTLENKLEAVEKEQKLLELQLKELQEGESSSKALQDKIKSLTGLVTAKEQEIEALMQALDEEESQMEGLTSKIDELEQGLQQKNLELETLEASRGKALAKLSITVSKFEELHHMSENLLSEVEILQSRLQDRDAEVSFLRQEVTRCTNEVLGASQENNKKLSNESHELVTWLSMMTSRLGVRDELPDDKKGSQIQAYKEILEWQITSIVSELENLRVGTQSRDALLEAERSRVEELLHRKETLENSLREKETELSMLQGAGVSGQAPLTSNEILEVEPVMNKRTVGGASIVPHVRSLRKGNNDQVAISIDMDQGSSTLDDVDDDKVHGFKSLTMSRIVPRFTRPVTDMIDGLWVSCDRALMRQPILRLGIIIYWSVLHMLLATFIV
ncbi:centrosome-associated protein CEP250 isoform X2 [Telopea speciosissima]|uniref:centrosome-associated protein CEP250 isoform X2 n=1 Tax=Telopea speciosissima TaxID=54955 RepID=UPI001CC5F856|nr:centrosome-associated protein CEP250 isoform X2 [Telopea speciosissima]